MPKFRVRENRRIEAVQFWPEEPWSPYIYHTGQDEWAVYNALHDSCIKLEPGDWLNITDPGDVYPIKADIFAERYEAVDE